MTFFICKDDKGYVKIRFIDYILVYLLYQLIKSKLNSAIRH
jgi:hypothetical protein